MSFLDAIETGASNAGLDGVAARERFKATFGGVSRTDVRDSMRNALSAEAEAVRSAGRTRHDAAQKGEKLRARMEAAKAGGDRIAAMRSAADDALRIAAETHARSIAGAASAEEKAKADKDAVDAQAALDTALVDLADDIALVEHGARPLAEAEAKAAAAERGLGLVKAQYLMARHQWAENQMQLAFLLHVEPWASEILACHFAAIELLGARLDGYKEAKQRSHDGFTFAALNADATTAEIMGALRKAAGVPGDWRVKLPSL